MKRFVIRIILLSLIVLAIDTAFGYAFNYLQSHSKGGATHRMEYIANSMTDSILIMGSSRAIHHYDPRIFVDSLDLSSYNCGLNGMGIIYNYGQYCLFKERHVPKIIIYDICDQFDLLTKVPNDRYLDGLRPYYDRVSIDSIFYSIDKTEKYKMMSQMRKYNGHFTSLVLYYLRPNNDYILGFKPLKGQMAYEPQKSKEENAIILDSIKIKYLEKLIHETRENGTKLIFCISPTYGGADEITYQSVMDLAKANEIPVLNHYNDSSFILKKEYFKDSYHLNEAGAQEYTKTIVKEIREITHKHPTTD